MNKEKKHDQSVIMEVQAEKPQNKIVIVEDDHDLRNMLSKILKRAGYDVLDFDLGKNLLDLPARDKIDLVITDFRLPDISGLELAKKLKDLDSELCIILMTGHATLEMAVEAIKKDIDEYMIKPVDIAALKRSIKTLLVKQGLIRKNRELMKELKIANNELEELDKLKSQFLSMVTHELCTPLTTIQGFTQVLLTGQVGQINEKQEEFLDIIYKDSRNLYALINELLDISRMDAGKFEIELARCNIGQILEPAMKSFKLKADEKKIKLISEFTENLPAINADERRLTQVINNFLSNAVKFTPEGGKIILRSSIVNNEMLVEVIDSGDGIDPADCEKVFDRFYQSRKSDRKKGLGLGLAISKQIIHEHKGEIGAERNNTGKGSRFWFKLGIAL